MTNTTIGYVRVSTSKQLDGNGPDQQRAAILVWAAANGVEKIDEWVVEDESGTKEDREKILRLLERAKAGERFTLVIDRQDRLGRRLVVCESLFTRFREAGVNLVCAQTHFENNAYGVFMRQVMGSVAELQRSEWLDRMRSCRKLAVARKGRHSGGAAPFGYRSVGDGKLVEDPKAATMVRHIFALADSGKGIRAISRELGWYPTQVKRIIDRRAFYAGTKPLLTDAAYEAGVKPCHPPLIGDQPMHVSSQQALMDASTQG